MSLKINTLSNYMGRIYLSFVGILILPLYLRFLGAEAFGLISLFTIIQSWLRIFDMGIMPTLSREVAFHRSQTNSAYIIKQLVRTLEITFLIFNIIAITAILLCSNWIAYHWLKVEKLNYNEVISCIKIMGLIIALHWFSDLYRACFIGMEKQVLLNNYSIAIVTLQYGGGYILLSSISQNPIHFFEYQLFIAMIELLILGFTFYRMLPTHGFSFWHVKIPWELIKKVIPFSCGVAYTGILFTILVETNKLLLSHILPLSLFGYFALVVIISNGIIQLAAPISDAILPRMTFLFSQGNKTGMLRIYRNATQIMAVIMFSINGIVAIFSTQLIYAWTGNHDAATWAGPILFWYSLGNGFASIMGFQYYLQYVYGELRLHVIANTIIAIVLIPMLYFSAYRWGAIGTAISWFLIQGITFIILPPIIHKKYAPGIHSNWILKDIMPIFLAIVATLFCIKQIPLDWRLIDREESFIVFSGLFFLLLSVGALSSSTCRTMLSSFFRKEVM